MTESQSINYQRIAAAIEYLTSNFKAQPTLEDVAAVVGLSPYHFQRMFTGWAGVSPKKFVQYLSVEHAKMLLKDQQTTLLDTALETGLSGPSRLHDLFVSIEAMTPGEYKDGGKTLSINYAFKQSPFGQIIVASTERGVCYMAFEHDQEVALQDLNINFPQASFTEMFDAHQQKALTIFECEDNSQAEIKLHLKGTPFQLKVWETLLKLPLGHLATYGQMAQHIEQPTASRAVGTHIGRNPVAFLIPCHRVIQKTGERGGYRWGETRKSAIIGWESSQIHGSVE